MYSYGIWVGCTEWILESEQLPWVFPDIYATALESCWPGLMASRCPWQISLIILLSCSAHDMHSTLFQGLVAKLPSPKSSESCFPLVLLCGDSGLFSPVSVLVCFILTKHPSHGLWSVRFVLCTVVLWSNVTLCWMFPWNVCWGNLEYVNLTKYSNFNWIGQCRCKWTMGW